MSLNAYQGSWSILSAQASASHPDHASVYNVLKTVALGPPHQWTATCQSLYSGTEKRITAMTSTEARACSCRRRSTSGLASVVPVAAHGRRVAVALCTTLHHDQSAKVALEMLDATALLWRMHLDGIDTGDRWSTLADAWAEKTDNEPWYAFNDMHAAMAFAAAGRLDDIRALVARLRRYVAAAHSSVSNRSMTAGVGLPVCEAILAFAEARYDDTVQRLHSIRRLVHRFGGSNAQRDVVARTLLEAAIRGGDRTLAHALASERLAIKESSPYNRRQLDRARHPDARTAPAAVAAV